jgi:hypothetical protein
MAGRSYETAPPRNSARGGADASEAWSVVGAQGARTLKGQCNLGVRARIPEAQLQIWFGLQAAAAVLAAEAGQCADLGTATTPR